MQLCYSFAVSYDTYLLRNSLIIMYANMNISLFSKEHMFYV
jgi:hypothetical protein